VPQPRMATLLADNLVPQMLQYANQPIRSDTARQFHAASTGINSSFT
jgi:hypothetical protein